MAALSCWREPAPITLSPLGRGWGEGSDCSWIPINFHPVPYKVQENAPAFNVVSDSIVSDAVPPFSNADTPQFSTRVRIGLEAFERPKDLCLNLPGEVFKVVFEPFRGE